MSQPPQPPPGPPSGSPSEPPSGPQAYGQGRPPYGQQGGPYGPSPYAQRVPPAYPAYPPYPHPRREPYHRILRTWSYHYWRVLVGVPLVLLLGVVFGPLVVALLVGLVVQMLGLGSAGEVLNSLDLQGRLHPPTLLVVNLSLALLIPITWLAVRFLHNLRPRWLGSVRPGLRWSLVGWFLGAAFVATVLSYSVAGLVTPQELPASTGGGGAATGGTTAAFLVVIAVTSPLQAAGEEYFFRGYLLQAFGALVRQPWFALVCTSVLFAFAHGSQNLPLFVDRLAFGLVAGGLVLYTGGLEAGIAMHVINNVVVLGAAAATGTITQTLGTSDASWTLVVIDLGQFVVYAGLVVLLCRRFRPERLTAGPPEGASTAPPVGPPAPTSAS